jgi:poly(3-hydroxybutyrate) depolymerase
MFPAHEMLHLASRRRGRQQRDVARDEESAQSAASYVIRRNVAASAELFERMTAATGNRCSAWTRRLSTAPRSRSSRRLSEPPLLRPAALHGCLLVRPRQSKLLIVAPMSGHYATLLRGTVEAFLPTHDVCVTD